MRRFSKMAVILLIPFLLLLSGVFSSSCSAGYLEDQKKSAPDFTLSDINGNDVSLSEFINKKPVLLVFGATWCPYCLQEIPDLKQIYNKYKDDKIKLIYIDVQESQDKVAQFVKDNALPYTTLVDARGRVASLYGVQGIPHQVLIDVEGIIYYEGPKPYGGVESLLIDFLRR